jgi:hypothetical protein
MIFAIDFDGTIVEHDFPRIGKLKENAKETINKLCDAGHKIIIWTCRYEDIHKTDMVKFLLDNDIKYHKINCNISDIGFTPFPKVYADIYIDDRNLFYKNVDWFVIEDYLIKKNILND